MAEDSLLVCTPVPNISSESEMTRGQCPLCPFSHLAGADAITLRLPRCMATWHADIPERLDLAANEHVQVHTAA